MTAAGSDDTKVAACDVKGRTEAAKALGRGDADVDADQFREWKRKSALDRVQEAMLGCLSMLNTSATSAATATAKTACRDVTVRQAAEESMGKKPGSYGTVEAMDLVLDAAANGAVKKNKACLAAAESKAERSLCRNSTRSSLAQLMGGKASVKEADFDRILTKASAANPSNI